MTIHPDILTDLITLYHAGEASQASRALLEEEASRNPQVAAALAAAPGGIPPLPAHPAAFERKVLRKLRFRYQLLSFAIVWTFALVAVAFVPRLLNTSTGVAMAIQALPFAVLLLFFGGAIVLLCLLIRRLR
jgi:hypothetical protein